MGHNILEFKSEDDELNIDKLYKVLAYACLYKSYGKTIDEIKAKDITATVLRKRKSVKLFKYFEENKNAVTKVHNGIYKIDGFYFPIQIIVTGELSQENHTWVSSIARKNVRKFCVKCYFTLEHRRNRKNKRRFNYGTSNKFSFY